MQILKLFIVGTLLLLSNFALNAQCDGHKGMLNSVNLGSRSAGELQLDAQFNRTKGHLQDFFGIKVDLYFYEEETGAQALTFCSSLYSEIYDGTIRFGLGLLRNELRIRTNGEHAAAAILAHEFAHIFQCRVGGSLRHFKRELQADFLAGYFLGRKSYSYRYEVDIVPFANELFADDTWYEPFHYGTPRERAEAMIFGFHNAHLGLEAAYIKSLYHFNAFERADPQGHRYQACDLCEGHGVTDRPTVCNICSGHGQYECNICSGKGEFSLFNKKHDCGACAKSGELTCAGCEGSGQSHGSKTCPKCKGKKRILKTDAAKLNRP